MAWEARRKIQRKIDGQKEKAQIFVKRAGEKTNEKVKESLREGLERSKGYLRGRLGGFTEKFPSVLPRFSRISKKDATRLPERKSGSGSETAMESVTKSLNNSAYGSNGISSKGSADKGMAIQMFDSAKSMFPSISNSTPKLSKPQSLSNQSRPQQQMTDKAKNLAKSILTSETTTAFAGNIATTFQESVRKSTRWLWWWGLAAVGVYGITTTLTKEGMSILKELMGLSKSGLSNEIGNGNRTTVISTVNESKDDLPFCGPLDSDGYLNIDSDIIDKFDDDGVDHDKSGNPESGLESSSSSWFSSFKRLVRMKTPNKNDCEKYN
ncbi:hypothetical protein ACHAXS_011595 [Conticribra weissflogii]